MIQIGYDKQYGDNYDRIFKKSLKTKIREFLEKLFYNLFIK
jgi:hypothetical protein